MRYFKVVPPEEFSYHYSITLKDELGNVIGKHKLNILNNNDALTLLLIHYFDDSSIIEFYGKQFKVKKWRIDNINREIEIYI